MNKDNPPYTKIDCRHVKNVFFENKTKNITYLAHSSFFEHMCVYSQVVNRFLSFLSNQVMYCLSPFFLVFLV